MSVQEEVKQLIVSTVAKMKEKSGIQQVIWIGAGGSFGGFYGAHYFLQQEAKKIFTSMYTSGEFIYAPPKNLDERTLVVLCSMRGTKETIKSAQIAHDYGATTIAMYVEESDLIKIVDYKIKYESLAIDESNLSRVNGSIGLCIAMNLLNEVEGYQDYAIAMQTFSELDPIYRRAIKYSTPLAQKWAKLNKDEDTIYVIASGPAFGAAYVFSICNLEEMLQLNAPTVHSYEYFNGPFEVTDKNKSIFQLLATGKTRKEDERALRFEQRFGGDKLYVLDGKELGLDDIQPSVSAYFNHSIFSSILNNVYMRALAKELHQNFLTRRYMWKDDYL